MESIIRTRQAIQKSMLMTMRGRKIDVVGEKRSVVWPATHHRPGGGWEGLGRKEGRGSRTIHATILGGRKNKERKENIKKSGKEQRRGAHELDGLNGVGWIGWLVRLSRSKRLPTMMTRHFFPRCERGNIYVYITPDIWYT